MDKDHRNLISLGRKAIKAAESLKGKNPTDKRYPAAVEKFEEASAAFSRKADDMTNG